MQPRDIAIIGLACRYPAASNPGDFWRLIRDGSEVTRQSGSASEFDADFFNVSPREACAMDPRQRLALELSWELLEDAFVIPEAVHGQQVSVYLGAMTDDYALLTLGDEAQNLDHHSFAGISRGMIANRVSYALGLHGPSMTVDSGQSSSLVAVHLACEGLRRGESSLAIAGGVQLNLAAETEALEREFGAMSGSGHTYAFDGRADGYVRGEGGGLVLLKPLSAALEDGDRIRAVIVGDAVGNAGHRSAGQTVPSVAGQADVIRLALASAALGSGDIDYIEAHGTGTRVGDFVEASALGEIFAERQEHPVQVGSVKTNIGHAGGAAGVAGLLKAVLAIENGQVPPSVNYAGSRVDIDLKSLGLQVETRLVSWPVRDRPRRAGVSSFGMGGTNAHVIVEQAPADSETSESPARQDDNPELVVPWVLSARSAEALAGQARRLLARVTADPGLRAVDIGWSLVTTRSVFEHRAVLVGGRRALSTGLTALAADEPGTAVVGRAARAGKTAFVFPGSPWPGMGRQLYDRFGVFARAFDEVAEVLDGQLPVPLKQVIWGADPDVLDPNDFDLPALFAVEVAVAALWRSWGVLPDVVLGHSAGEIAAAHVAGVLSLRDAARVLAAWDGLAAGSPAGAALAEVSPDAPRIALVSNLSGQLAGPGYGSAAYWVDHARRTERFVDGVRVAESLGAGVIVEVGPGGVSGAAADQSLTTEQSVSVVAMPEDRPETESLLHAAGQLFTCGVGVDWPAVFAGLDARRVELPTYSFVRQKFWLGGGGDVQTAKVGESVDLAEQLHGLSAEEQRRRLVELVQAQAAVVLGHSGGDDIDAERAFQDLGFDSLTGVELRNRLKINAGLALSRTLTFDYPTPAALAEHLRRQLLGGDQEESEEEQVRSLLSRIPVRDLRRTGLLDQLLILAGGSEESPRDAPVGDDVIDSLSPDDLIAMALKPRDEGDGE